MQKRIAILGGAGFIGSHLCLHLLDLGHEVLCVDLRDAANSPLLRPLRHPGFRYIHHNIIHNFSLRCDQIYNLTSPSMVRYNTALPVETLKVSILGSINTLETARAEHARVLFTSMSDLHDSCLPDSRVADNCCSTHHLLVEGKRAGEALHHAYQTEYGVDARIARIFNTYGSGAELMDQRVVMKMIVAALQQRDILINGSGEQIRTFCWIDDIVDGLVRLMEAPPVAHTRTVNLGSPHEITIRALAEKIIALTGSHSKITHAPSRVDEVDHRPLDLSAARDDLGWTPRTPLVEGLRRTIEYVEKELKEHAYAHATWVEMN